MSHKPMGREIPDCKALGSKNTEGLDPAHHVEILLHDISRIVG